MMDPRTDWGTPEQARHLVAWHKRYEESMGPTTKRVMDALARVETERQAQSPYERLVMDHAYGYTVQHEEFVRDLDAVRSEERRITVLHIQKAIEEEAALKGHTEAWESLGPCITDILDAVRP